MVANTDYVLWWKSKGLSAENIKPRPTSDNSLISAVSYYGTKTIVKFIGSCFKTAKNFMHYAKVINIYIFYELGTSSSHDDDPTLKNCLFGAVTLTKNVDIDKYHDSGYGIGFHWKGSFSFRGSGIGENVIIFGADTSSSVSVGNEGKYILILGSGPTQGLGEHSLTAEKKIFH